MRPGFKRELMDLSQRPKEKDKTESAEQTSQQDDIKETKISEAIFNLQKKKQEIMAQLHEELTRIDDPEYKVEKTGSTRIVYYNENKGGYYIQTPKRRITLSESDLLSYYEWPRK